MCPKSVITPFVVHIIPVILQLSNGKPMENSLIQNTTLATEISLDIYNESEANSSFLETVSVFLTVLSPNDTATSLPDFITTTELINANTTVEPEYYDHQNNSTASAVGELEVEFDTSMSMYLGSSTEPPPPSSLLSSLTDDEMEVAGSLDESVTTNVLMLKEDCDSGGGDRDHDNNHDHNDETRSSTNISRNDSSKDVIGDSSTQSLPAEDEDDSIIIAASMSSSNMNVDTVEPPFSQGSNANATEETVEVITSSFSLQEIHDVSSSEPLSYTSPTPSSSSSDSEMLV